MINISTIWRVEWKVAARIDRLTGAVCINEQILLHTNGYYYWMSTETIFMNVATYKRVLQ